MNYTAKKKRRWQERMKALEEEHRKIQVFHRELPLSLELVNQDIENCRQQLCFSRSEEQTSREEGPVLEEFMPLKRSFSSSQEEVEEESDRTNEKIGQKVDWLRSVQLWNQTPDPLPPSKEVIEKKKRVGAFHPFRKDEEIAATTTIGTKKTTTMPMASTSSTTDNNDRRVQVEKEEQSKRKVRRSWSNELHQKFLHALQQLGGSHAATPKQIREFMKVDGLTNDEVKSHLQKYRLHTTRPSPPIQNNGNPQPTQYVLVGGIWPPPAEYAPTVVTKVDTTMKMKATKGVYVPIAISPQLTLASYPHHHQQQQQQQQQQQKQLYSEERSSRAEYSVGDNNDHSSSPTSSSSTHSTTASPTF